MAKITRGAALRAIGATSLLGITLDSRVWRSLLQHVQNAIGADSARGAIATETLKPIGMMGTRTDMRAYMELFDRHTEIKRKVEQIPGGVRTVTESDAPDLVARLQAHVASMYEHLDQGAEVTCMSQSLPTLFRHASGYRRQLTITRKGVAVTETSHDPKVTQAIRQHAREVTGFVREGMQAMMQGGMGG
jgi:hypothetical protein